MYIKASGSGNTGWSAISGGISCASTNGIAYWNGTGITCTGAPGANVVLAANSGAPIWTSTPTAAQFIATTSLTSPILTSGSSLTLNPTGDLITDPTGNDILPVTNYDINIGGPTLKYLSLRAAELVVDTLVAQDVIATIGGRVVIAPTSALTSDLASGATSMVVKHNQMATGDIVRLEARGNVEFVSISSGPSGSGPYMYSIGSRNLDGTGANDWIAGDAVLNTGVTGDGMIDMFASTGLLNGFGPSIIGSVRTGSTYSNIAPRWAAGNLNAVGYGHATNTYGFAAGNPSGAHVYLDDTNGLVMGGPGGIRMQITPAGVASFYGDGGGVTNINGGNITSDSVTATQIAAGAITASEISAGAVTAAKLASGNGSNFIRNSECRTSAEEWAINDGTSGAASLSFALSPWRLLDQSNTCYVVVSGSPTGAAFTQFYAPEVAAKAGQAYEASVYIGAHRVEGASIILVFRNSAGAILSAPQGNICVEANGAGGTALSGYCRSATLGTAPATTHSVQIVIHMDYDGQSNPYTFWVRAYLGEAKPNQTEFTEWSPAGMTEITGGVIKTGTIQAGHILANTIGAAEIGANAITTSELAANSVTSAKIVAGEIDASHIAANSLTAGVIAAGAIETSELAANSVTAGKISVSSLDAISANLGTVTAGLLDGVEVRAGSSDEVILNSSGISLSSGTGDANKVKWSGGATLFDASGSLQIDGDSSVSLRQDVQVERHFSVGENVRFNALSSLGTNRFVCHDNEGDLYSSATTCDGSSPSAGASASSRQREIQEYQALIEKLIALAARIAELEKLIGGGGK